MPPVPILSPAQSEDWDRLAESAGMSRATLMESAGRAAAAVVARRFGAELARGAIIAAGTGNNGGDGWVLARALHRLGAPVWVAAVAGERSALCAAAAELAIGDGVRQLPPDGPWPSAGLAVDALLGTGARGAPRAPVASLMERIGELRVPVVALDGPTGLDLGTGVMHGAPRADLTITFGGFRRGHLLARDEAGTVVVVDIGHPPAEPDWPRLLTDEWSARHGPRFSASSHKGERGRIVIVGGAPGMSGALRLAARSALATGAGYVHAVAPPATIAELREAEPELLTLELELEADPSAGVLDLVRRADALLIGPGLGRAEGRAALVSRLVTEAHDVVLDADALTAFQGKSAALADASAERRTVLTPHPGEFRSVFPELAALREVDPWEAAATASGRLGATLLLKGVPTVVGHEGRAPWTVAAGNPGLGTGGSGDVLSGIITTLMAQSRDPLMAACLGAQALGRAADIAAARVSVRSMRPQDVIEALGEVWSDWESRRQGTPLLDPPVLAELPGPALG